MPRKRTASDKLNWQRAKVSAKELLIALGIERKRLPDITEVPTWIPEPVTPIPDYRQKKFKRTKEEMKQLRAFTEWQKQQRILKSKLDNGVK